MSNISEQIFADVCLDERVTGGIFKLDEDEHMNALRDYFVKRGITKESSVNITNRMVEGKFPERQAYNENGILCTFPTPEYKAAAIKRGTHFEENPNPQPKSPVTPSPEAGPKPLPKLPGDTDKKSPEETGEPNVQQNIFNKEPATPIAAGAGENNLQVEPPAGTEEPAPTGQMPVPTLPQAPRTPERIAAEKDVIKQMIATNDNALTSIDPKISEICRKQLNELYKNADKLGFKEAVTFLTPYVKP